MAPLFVVHGSWIVASGSSFRGSSFRGSSFRGSSFRGSSFRGSSLTESSYRSWNADRSPWIIDRSSWIVDCSLQLSVSWLVVNRELISSIEV
ncbi:pentapeptide repeat-containing protein [Paenibacillus sp. GCM10012306]|uniref:pentapeptide repeat-containing protein n=1 Tax=Paenibacillus sp. GCM10012306 TaxID=3317342 RepID=UPI0036071C01